MSTNTYTALDKITVGTAVSFVEFTGINAGYTDLVLVINSAVSGASNRDVYMQFNGDTGSNYSATILYGTGSAAGSTRFSNGSTLFTNYYGSASTTFGTIQTYNFQNYSSTTTHKTILSHTGRTAGGVDAAVGLWRSTSAITSIKLYTDVNWSTGSTFSLYGIASEGSGYASGGQVTSDANYYYHTFTSSGTFTPKKALTCDYLVVAGGGGGGWDTGGGGGAGGLRSSVTATGGGGSLPSALSLNNGTAYTVTVGAGGAGATSGSARGSSGIASVFSTVSTVGGGGGGSDGTAGSGTVAIPRILPHILCFKFKYS